MFRRIFLALAATLLVAGCAGTDQVQRPERPGRPDRPDRPGWIDPYPDLRLREERQDRPIRPYPGLAPW